MSTAAELDAVLDDMQAWSRNPGYGVVAEVSPAGDPSIGLEVGVRGEAGMAFFSSHTPQIEVMSIGNPNAPGQLDYRYQGTK